MGQARAGDRRTARTRRVRQVAGEHRPQPLEELRVGHAGQWRYPEDLAGHRQAQQLWPHTFWHPGFFTFPGCVMRWPVASPVRRCAPRVEAEALWWEPARRRYR